MTSESPKGQPSDLAYVLTEAGGHIIYAESQDGSVTVDNRHTLSLGQLALLPPALQHPDAGRNPAPREEHDMADIDAPNPLNRLKADPDTFGPDQHIIETWADAEGTETFPAELDDMPLRDIRQLAALAESVAQEHDRRANRAHRVVHAVRERLVELSGYREQAMTGEVARGH